MAKSQVATSLRRRVRRPLLPRRLTEDEARKKYRKQHMKRPLGPVDSWLCAASATVDGLHAPANHDDVQCTIIVVVKAPPVPDHDDPFIDPEEWELLMAVTNPPSDCKANTVVPQPQIVLATYKGSKHSLDAPEWTQRKPGQQLIIRQSRAELTELLSRIASSKNALDALTKDLQFMKM
ncbi:hypothetical protein EIP86_002479 [Pleurotus ostreatoroseus]|nr:hypothetical protein EIP86_002479 [Pleurotus ostreatoroseus]